MKFFRLRCTDWPTGPWAIVGTLTNDDKIDRIEWSDKGNCTGGSWAGWWRGKPVSAFRGYFTGDLDVWEEEPAPKHIVEVFRMTGDNSWVQIGIAVDGKIHRMADKTLNEYGGFDTYWKNHEGCDLWSAGYNDAGFLVERWHDPVIASMVLRELESAEGKP